MITHDEIEAELREYETRSLRATAAGAQAFTRLLHIAETRNSGQIERVAHFIAAVFDSQSFPLEVDELRAVDVAISDDMLLCLDALRWGQADLHTLVPEGEQRVLTLIERWGMRWPDEA